MIVNKRRIRGREGYEEKTEKIALLVKKKPQPYDPFSFSIIKQMNTEHYSNPVRLMRTGKTASL